MQNIIFINKMDKNKQGKKKSPQAKVSSKKSPRNSRSKSPSRRSLSPKPIGPRRRVAPFPVIYDEPKVKSDLAKLYEETLKFMNNRSQFY